jgi:hypothetical protein
MDPVTIKFVQLILAEILGAALCIFGVYLFIRGISGKSSLLLQGLGLKARLTNGAPGSIIALVGLALVALSLNSTVERTERTTNDSASVLQSWLKNSYEVTEGMNYGQVIDTIVGTDPSARFTNKNIIPDRDVTLGDEAQQEYGDGQYWHLLAAINKDRGYFRLSDASSGTKIGRGNLIEAWHVSRYSGMDTETRTRISGADRRAAYDELLERAARGDRFNADALTDEFQRRELTLAVSIANLSGVHSLRELSLKYYGDSKYWPLIVWANPDAFAKQASEETNPVEAHQPLLVIQFLGWPR